MDSSEAIAIINRERRLIEEWVNQDGLPDTAGLIKDRQITQCLRALREAARYAPLHEAAMVEKIVELAETRLNSAR
ncbi:MAG: hypothetical protein KME20_27070 [Kaiparowitsia implicata GSE-PSE-MK54-09C]|jgi:hypothetical protein|nr:hypothetical protein [Kaiparowitsia implicata GSE-PSE-MK54-09C]